ncbi:type II and III secretion system protein family protein [Novipirellula artificiosorum]|uniref:Type II secretion system protein D n=1 Tax=Novipirellula artificiosorum TaxID=2528016 RepID=A0A5C6DJA0_9BACT|nr:pilus assembly protein N-terminal domain-containing protein [Novipirellula artificiosorum]TWU35977.1 Type II secretion system protein D precursor [Novipirellula artificiosorum]
METNRLTAKFAASSMLAFCFLVSSPLTTTNGAEPVRLTSSESTASHSISQSVERLEMLVKSSRILTLEERIPKFQVHNEEVIGATPVSQNQIQVFAKTPGTTQLNLWDTNDKLYTVDVTVTADAREVEGILASQLPYASLKVMPVNASAIISGTVTSVDDVDRAVAIVEQFYPTVVNNIKVVGVQQVLLHTKIMEVSRTKLRDLGVDLTVLSNGNLLMNAPANLADVPASAFDGVGAARLFEIASKTDGANARIMTGNFDALIKALRQDDLLKLLAEPTVVATHGRPARFIVGGKVPYIVPTGNGAVTVNYEEYGTAVDFLPFVVGPGRIRLEVRPEVSEVDTARSIIRDGTQVYAFTHRYVETAVEMQAGQTFAIAGLLQSRTESKRRATPFFGELPYIGSLFRRVEERRNDIELLVTVTPEVVAAMDPFEVPCGGPGLSTGNPTDCEFYGKGFIEVPNLKGDGTCNTLSQGGYCADPNQAGYPSQGGYPQGYDQQVLGGPLYPPGAIVPGAEPMIVGDGVTVVAPQN